MIKCNFINNKSILFFFFFHPRIVSSTICKCLPNLLRKSFCYWSNVNMASPVVGVSVPSSHVNPDIQKERNTATFDPLQLTYVLDGGKEKTQRRRYVGT